MTIVIHDPFELQQNSIIGKISKRNRIFVGRVNNINVFETSISFEDIHDKTSLSIHSFTEFVFLQSILDSRILSGCSTENIKTDNKYYALYLHKSTNVWTTCYYQCQYIKHSQQTVSIVYVDDKLKAKIPAYANIEGFMLPTVIKFIPLIKSHPFQTMISNMLLNTDLMANKVVEPLNAEFVM